MAETNFHFPSSTGSYVTPAGNIRIKIFYDDTSTTNTDVAADLFKLGNLDYEFSVDKTDGRFSQIKITFLNIGNVFETNSIIDSDKEKETFVDIYKDGTLFFRGLLIHSEIDKTDYYLDGSSLKYHKITLTIHDCLKYFWLNDVTLSDVSYADHINLSTLLTTMITTYLYYSSGDVNIDSNIGAFDEACGNSYDISDFKLNDFSSAMLVSEFLKNLMQYLGCDIYSLGDEMVFASKIAGSSTTIQTADISEGLALVSNEDKVDYVAVQTDRYWGTLSADYTHSDSEGTNSENAETIELVGDDFLDRIYTVIAGTNYFGGISETAEHHSATMLNDEDENFYTEEIETGMIAGYDITYPGSPTMYSIILSVAYDAGTGSTITFPDNGTPTADGYLIDRNPIEDGNITLFKVHKLVQRLVDLYWDLFSNTKILKIDMIGISTYGAINNIFSFNSNDYRAKKASINFNKNQVKLELLEV